MTIDWDNLNSLSSADAKQRVFAILQEAGRTIQDEDNDQAHVVDIVPRLVSLLEQRPDLRDLSDSISTLARSVGLWNYISLEDASLQDQILAESMTQGEMLDHVTLHREQARALKIILDQESLVLSAPTSFGKSLLVDAALASNKFNRIAIIVPTLALLNEVRRRLMKRFRHEYDIVMHYSEIQKRDKVIFLGTQERLVNRPDLHDLDLVVVDEFYKLDSRHIDNRTNVLNAATYQLLRESKQFLFLGPNVERIAEVDPSRWKYQFLPTKFATVAVDTVDLSHEANKFEALRREVSRKDNWPALIFASSPERANELSKLLGADRAVGGARSMAEWLSSNFGQQWEISQAVAKGIGVHHGRIPRSVAAKFVQMFNEGTIPILICTSTLIEGVNTAAKSIFIYDDTINRKRHDFFTFSNIRGRAGRLGSHHIGKVYLFNPEPDPVDKEVGASIFDDFDEAPDDFIIHLEGDDISDRIRQRVNALAADLDLSVSELKRFSTLGISDLAKIKESVSNEIDGGGLEWFHWPTWDNLLACCRVICEVRQSRHFGAKSSRQLALYLHRLRIAYTLRSFFEWYSGTYWGKVSEMDRIFRFLRSCEYTLPEFFGAIELFVRKSGGEANYGRALYDLPRWFRSEPLNVFEERGIPVQIGERYFRPSDTVGKLGRRLHRAAGSRDNDLSDLEREWLLGLVL